MSKRVYLATLSSFCLGLMLNFYAPSLTWAEPDSSQTEINATSGNNRTLGERSLDHFKKIPGDVKVEFKDFRTTAEDAIITEVFGIRALGHTIGKAFHKHSNEDSKKN